MNSEIISKEETFKQIKSKVDLKNIESDYFLKKIFDIMKKNKSLIILKCNKKLQKRLNISIKDYKDYSHYYSPIELELKLEENEYEKFINLIKIKNIFIFILMIQMKK